MKFKFDEMSDLMHHFVIEGAVKLAESTGKELKELWPEMFQRKVPKVQAWELEVKLNGVELPADKVFKHLESQLDDFITKRAASILQDKFRQITDMIDDIEDVVLDRIHEEFPTFNKEDE